MAKTQPVTTYTSGLVTATNTTYNGVNKIVIPFEATKVEVSVVDASGNPLLSLSFDGVTDVATLHHDKASGAGSHEFQQQRVTTLYYKQSGTSCSFIVNAETQAWPNIF